MRESPLIILWLDNLGVFYPLIGELGLTNIAAAFEGSTVVHNLRPTCYLELNKNMIGKWVSTIT